MKSGGDPNGIRTRVTAVKGRCPRPLDDRVTKLANIGIALLARKVNCQPGGARQSLDEIDQQRGRAGRRTTVLGQHLLRILHK